MQANRSLYLLGPMRVEQGKQACAVKYTKARGLLAYLALQPGFHTRGALADLFWPDEDGQGGRDKLKRMLFHLRDTLGDELFESDRQVVRLRPESGLWIDAHVFSSMIEQASRTLDGFTGLDLAAHLQALADAAALYQGPFLHGLSVRDTPDLEQWIEMQREEYQRRRVFGERLLADGYARLGDLDQALAHARQLVSLAPFDEAGWQVLLALLLRAGRREEAETEYQRLSDLLREELDEAPGDALTQLLAVPPARMEQHATGPERRQLTVVAIEFLPNAADDPDQLVAALRPPLVQCETILRQSWGYTVRTPSGGLLGYFGYPTALEGAGRHAVEAAMRCAQASTTRVGIGVGVITGLVISSAADDSPDTGGRVSRMASQFAEMAPVGDVLICEATQRLIGPAFATLPHGTARERHANRDIPVFRINPDPTPERRSRRRAAMLFGRDAALAELGAAHTGVRDLNLAQGAVVLVLGEAGIGKTALARHFIESNSLRAIELSCSLDGAGTPFHPLSRWLRTLAGTDADANALPQPALLAQRRLVALFDAGNDVPDAVPHAWKQAVLDEAPALLTALLPNGGVLLVEDAHWADPSTQELLARMAETPPAGRLLFVCARPEFEVPWRHGIALRRVDLTPLDAGAAASIVRAATPRVALPAALRDRIVHLAEGVPLFLQELARAAASPHSGRTGANMAMPASLQELMMARIDAAGSAKPVAHFASCLGTDFQTDLLALASGRDLPLVERSLDTLVACGLIQRQEGGRYVFRHALLHKAAYDAQPQERRQDAHRRIALAMLERSPSIAQTEPEQLAWHFRQADDPHNAIEHYRLAGERATARQALREACAHYQSALDVLQLNSVPNSHSGVQELQLRMSMGVPLVLLHGYGSEPARHNFERALSLAQPLGDDITLFPVYWGLWLGSSSWSDFARAIDLSHKLIQIAQQAGSAPLTAHAYYALGNSLLCHGDFGGAVTALETCLSHYDPEARDTGLGEDARVTGLSFLSWAYWFTGRHDESIAASEEAITLGRKLGRRYSFAFALVFAAMLRRLRREIPPTEALAGEASEVSNETGVALWSMAGQTIRGWALASRGDASGLEHITDSVGRLGAIMGGVEGMFFGLLVEACAGTGDVALGLHAAERGAHVSAKRADGHWQAEFLRQKGEFLHAGGHPVATVRPWLEHALQVSQAQASPMLTLRAATSLLRLCGNDPAHVDALRGALTAIQGGESLADVLDARALLAKVGVRQTA